MTVRLVDTPTGPGLASIDSGGGEVLFYGGAWGSVAEAQRATADLHGVSLVVLIGLGLGEEVVELRAGHPVVERVVVIEPDPEVLAPGRRRPAAFWRTATA